MKRKDSKRKKSLKSLFDTLSSPKNNSEHLINDPFSAKISKIIIKSIRISIMQNRICNQLISADLIVE